MEHSNYWNAELIHSNSWNEWIFEINNHSNCSNGQALFGKTMNHGSDSQKRGYIVFTSDFLFGSLDNCLASQLHGTTPPHKMGI